MVEAGEGNPERDKEQEGRVGSSKFLEALSDQQRMLNSRARRKRTQTLATSDFRQAPLAAHRRVPPLSELPAMVVLSTKY